MGPLKFSVLLPTRDRLEYLRYAVETVRRQDYPDWEIVISDNFSTEDVAGYVAGLDDHRVKYSRTEKALPVTDNWNEALDRCSGDYVIMLGDDDGLTDGYFAEMRRLIDGFSRPDVIYTRSLLFAYPGVIPHQPEGYLQVTGCAGFFADLSEASLLDPAQAVALVRESMNFRLRFDYNMQLSLLRRGLIDELRGDGKFFHSPFPDFYATNIVFLKARKIVVDPRPLVIIGITPKSYGFYHFNKRESEGTRFLNNPPDMETAARNGRDLLPGNSMNTSWLLAMEAVEELHGSELHTSSNYGRYRFLQIWHGFTTVKFANPRSRRDFAPLWRRLRLREKLLYGTLAVVVRAAMKFLPQAQRLRFQEAINRRIGQYPEWSSPMTLGRYRTLIEVFEQVAPRGSPPVEVGS